MNSAILETSEKSFESRTLADQAYESIKIWNRVENLTQWALGFLILTIVLFNNR